MNEINVKSNNGMNIIAKMAVGILALLLAGFVFVLIG